LDRLEIFSDALDKEIDRDKKKDCVRWQEHLTLRFTIKKKRKRKQKLTLANQKKRAAVAANEKPQYAKKSNDKLLPPNSLDSFEVAKHVFGKTKANNDENKNQSPLNPK